MRRQPHDHQVVPELEAQLRALDCRVKRIGRQHNPLASAVICWDSPEGDSIRSEGDLLVTPPLGHPFELEISTVNGQRCFSLSLTKYRASRHRADEMDRVMYFEDPIRGDVGVGWADELPSRHQVQEVLLDTNANAELEQKVRRLFPNAVIVQVALSGSGGAVVLIPKDADWLAPDLETFLLLNGFLPDHDEPVFVSPFDDTDDDDE